MSKPSTPDLALPAASLPDQLQANAGRACALLRALGHEERLMILCSLTQGERWVGDIEARTGVSQPALSQHLTVLRANGCVSTRREGRRIYYSLSDPATVAVIATLYQWFCSDGGVCEAGDASNASAPISFE